MDLALPGGQNILKLFIQDGYGFMSLGCAHPPVFHLPTALSGYPDHLAMPSSFKLINSQTERLLASEFPRIDFRIENGRCFTTAYSPHHPCRAAGDDMETGLA